MHYRLLGLLMVSTLTPVDVCFNMLPKPKRHHACSSYGVRKPADVAVTLWSIVEQAAFIAGALGIYMYRENAIAFESEAMNYKHILSKADRRAFARKERNLHCDVDIAAVNKRTLPPLSL